MASAGDIVLNYGDSLLRTSEIEILKSNCWLNDVLIGFYFEYLDNQKSSMEGSPQMTFYPPGISQIVKLACDPAELPILLGPAEDVIYGFFAVNNSSSVSMEGSSGSHWSLLVWSRPDNAFLHFDSSNDGNLDSARKLCNSLRSYYSSTATFESVSTGQQANGRDCGLHVLLNAKLIMEHVQKKLPQHLALITPSASLVTATAPQTKEFRGKLLSLIEKLAKES